MGQKAVTVVLAQMVSTGQVPDALLFSGPRGTGKTSVARVLSRALGCREGSTDVLELDAASHGGVAEVRRLGEELSYRAAQSRRLVILDEAQSFSKEAFNALLKILEEPPPDTTFVLVTTQPKSIPETVFSRLMQFEFGLISIDDIEKRLTHIVNTEQIEVTADLIREISLRAEGGLRQAVMTLDMCHRAAIITAEDFHALIGQPDHGPTLVASIVSCYIPELLDLTREAVAALGTAQAVADQIVACLRDVLVLRVGGKLTGLSELPIQRRAHLARVLDSNAVFAALKLMWDLRTKTRVGEDSRLALELAVVLLCDVLGSRKPEQTPVNQRAVEASSSQPMTLDQLREET